MIHNHACNTRELPACCCQHSQVEPCSNTEVKSEEDDKKRDLVEKRIDVTKEDELSVPTLALSRETNHTESARLQKLRIEYARYLQMLKVGLPRVVVDHKLQAEDKDPDVLDELIRTAPHVKRLSAPLQIPPMNDLIENDDLEHMQQVDLFRRMIKVGVPRPVVEMKARREGVEMAELDTPSFSRSEHALKTVVDGTLELTHEKMATRSSISSTVSTAPSTPDALAARLASNAAGGNGRELAMQALRKMNNGTRKRLHWYTTPYTESVVPDPRQQSLWSRVHEHAPAGDGVSISSESRRCMEQLFVKVVSKAKAAQGDASTNEDEFFQKQSLDSMEKHERARSNPMVSGGIEQGSMKSHLENNDSGFEQKATRAPGSAFRRRTMCVMLLDHKKSQNIAIVLARVKQTFTQLTHQIATLNCDVLSSPALHSLIGMWPDSAEQEAIDNYGGDVSSLATVSAVCI